MTRHWLSRALLVCRSCVKVGSSICHSCIARASAQVVVVGPSLLYRCSVYWTRGHSSARPSPRIMVAASSLVHLFGSWSLVCLFGSWSLACSSFCWSAAVLYLFRVTDLSFVHLFVHRSCIARPLVVCHSSVTRLSLVCHSSVTRLSLVYHWSVRSGCSRWPVAALSLLCLLESWSLACSSVAGLLFVRHWPWSSICYSCTACLSPRLSCRSFACCSAIGRLYCRSAVALSACLSARPSLVWLSHGLGCRWFVAGPSVRVVHCSSV